MYTVHQVPVIKVIFISKKLVALIDPFVAANLETFRQKQ